jgi:hypothetical protein
MPRFHGRHRARFAHRGRVFGGLIWPIGLGILFVTGHWWPGILILVGLNVILSSFGNWSEPPVTEEDKHPEIRPAPIKPVIITPIISAPVHRTELLPAACPNCGGPARSNEVKWIGPQSAACAYCGSTLPMKKS